MRIFSCCIALLLLFAGPASAQWTVEYQPDLYNDFYEIVFPSATVGYIVGTGGSIMKSTDGGSTWVDQTSPVPDSFFDVFFIDVNNGWAVGDNGAIVSTTDGGANWVEHPQSKTICGSDINSICFVGSSGWFGSDDDNVYGTTDGGATWDTIGSFGDDVTSVSFASATVGYVALDGDGIAYTSDGGTNWTAASVNLGPYPYTRDDIEAVQAIDATTAVASGWGSMVGYQPMIILVSTDAGQTWSCPDVTYPWNTLTYGYSITLFDDGEVFITGGGSGFAAPNVSSTNYVDFARRQEFCGTTLRGAAQIPGTNTLMAVGDDGVIATSADRGITWTYNYNASFGFAGITAFAHNGTTTYAAGGSGLFMKKVGSADWTQPKIVSPNGFCPNLSDIAYIDGTIYVSGTYDYLAKSTDDGATWTEMYTVTSLFDAIYGMSWFDADNGILVGELNRDDVIYKTTDGGATRTTIQHNVVGGQFNSVHFARGQKRIGVICGDEEPVADDQMFFYTVDGGNNWSLAYDTLASSTEDFEEVFMVDKNTAWAVGDNGLIVKSEDGGMSWYQQPSWTASIELLDVHFNPLNGHGFICGNDQTARQSTDGGATWTDMAPVLQSSGDDINAIYLNPAANKLYIGADYAQIQYWDNSPTGDTPMSLPFALNQNYPNPFNPSTTISFTIDRDGFVSLNVYDVAGRTVGTILNKHMTAGTYEVGFNASGLASGVYFYKLRTNEQEMTRKMILLR